MKLTTLRKSRSPLKAVVSGTARLDRRTRNLARRAGPGDIAVIDHLDIDRAAAVALVEAGVAAVVNAAPSTSGRYPNLGPKVLLDAGIVLVDDTGAGVFGAVDEGDRVRIDGDTIYCGDREVASGTRQDALSVAAALHAAKDGITNQLEAFSANAVEHLRRERGTLLDGAGVPALTTGMRGRHVLIVLRAFDYRADLKALKTYVRENSPVLVGVDAGADALIEAGYRPDLVVCDGDEISDVGLRCGAEVVIRTSHDGQVASGDRIERLGVNYVPFATGGTCEDAAMLLAHAGSAALIVVAGSHGSLEELLDKGRSSMASSFLTRATVGAKLVDARAVAALYHHRVRGWLVLLLLLVSLALVAAAVATTPVGQDWWSSLQAQLDDAYAWVRGRL
jgi:uncharacterized membrane-anchored protein